MQLLIGWDRSSKLSVANVLRVVWEHLSMKFTVICQRIQLYLKHHNFLNFKSTFSKKPRINSLRDNLRKPKKELAFNFLRRLKNRIRLPRKLYITMNNTIFKAGANVINAKYGVLCIVLWSTVILLNVVKWVRNATNDKKKNKKNHLLLKSEHDKFLVTSIN
jgi:hypothetical protein